MTKYNNKKVVLNGITFDSQKEARRYRDLSLLERAGEHLGCYVEKNNGMPVGLAAWVNGALYGFEQAAKAQAVPRWISTSDRMPKEGEEVLVHSLGQVRQVTRDSKWAGGFKERNCYGWQAAYGQSHWMPKNIELPEEYHFYYKNDAKQKAMLEAQEPAND